MNEFIEKLIGRLEERKQLHNRVIAYEQKSGTVAEEFQQRKAVEVLDDVIKIVNQLAEEYNNGWIPCTVVDHPKHCNDCEVTTKDSRGYRRNIAFHTDKWRRASDEVPVLVVAWKEPSAPYQPKGE